MRLQVADPFIFWDDKSKYYYIYSTSKSNLGGKTFSIHKSKNLKDFEFVGYALDTKKLKHCKDWFWAPEVYYSKYNKHYFMFYSSRIKDEYCQELFNESPFVESCKICVAYADNPEGPFISFDKEYLDYFPYDISYKNVDRPKFDFDQKEEHDDHKEKIGTFIPLIDANLLIDENRIYLYASRCCYKNLRFDHDIDRYVEESEIVGTELNTDWYYSDKLIKPSVKAEYRDYYGKGKDRYLEIISYKNNPQKWENANCFDYYKYQGKRPNRRWNEGSFTLPIVTDGKKEYIMFYSANCYLDSSYDMGIAISKNPLFGFEKSSSNPLKIVTNNKEVCSTGHCSVIKRDNQYLCCLHGRDNASGERHLYLGDFTADFHELILDDFDNQQVK